MTKIVKEQKVKERLGKSRDKTDPCISRKVLLFITRHSSLIFFSALFLFPIYFMIVTSLMNRTQSHLYDLWPRPFVWGNYSEILKSLPFMRWILNSLLVAILCSIGGVLSSLPPAYALSRLEWRGRKIVTFIVLSSMMIPLQVTIFPSYWVYSHIGWVPSLFPLIVPFFFTDIFSIFIFRQFLIGIPDQFSESARVDGVSEISIMLKIVLPIIKPAIFAVTMLIFISSWNDFFMPSLFTSENPNLWTLPVGLAQIYGTHNYNANLMMAASCLFILPVLILFFAAQKYFIDGIKFSVVQR
jgi:multiple sugar transport system permease protein